MCVCLQRRGGILDMLRSSDFAFYIFLFSVDFIWFVSAIQSLNIEP